MDRLRAFGVAVALTLLPGPAWCAGEPAAGGAARPAAVGARPRTRVSLITWNDHTTASYNAAALAWGERGLDGNDLGFTYGVGVAVERTFADGLTWTFAGSSKLYLRPTGAPPSDPGSGRMPVWYTEEDEASLSLDSRARGLPRYWRIGGGIFVDNKGTNLFGSLRQQQEFHEIFRSASLNHYEYHDAGGRARGMFGLAAVGVQGERVLGRGVRVSGLAELCAAQYTQWSASQAVQSVEGRVGIPLGRVLLEAALRNETTLHPHGVAYQPGLTLALTLGRWSLASTVALPRGELPNHVRYNDDRDPIATLALSVLLD